MGYFGGLNKALTNPCILRQNWSHVLGRKRETVEREEEGEEKRKRKEEDSSQDQASQGMDAWILIWNFCFVWISCLDICLWVMGCRKPNPRMNLCMEIPLFL